jgi:hypothetical protein
MFTSVGAWFYKSLGGISVSERFQDLAENSSVFNVDPSVVGALAGVTASYATERGNIPIIMREGGVWSYTDLGPIGPIDTRHSFLCLVCGREGE